MPPASYSRADFDHSPLLVFYELTQACDLACQHCRACAQPLRDPEELSTQHARMLFEQLTHFPKPPLLVFTGGDPLKRADVFELVQQASSLRLETAMTPSATPLVTPNAIDRLKAAGLHRLAVSLDAADAKTHDAFRGVPGSFDRTLQIIACARAAGLPVQINTTLTNHNVHQVDALADLLGHQGIVLWSVFFLIPVGRGQALQRISGEQHERVFAKLWDHARRQPYAIKTTEAPHYRRFLIQQPKASAPATDKTKQVGTNDGRGVMFISHKGEIYPSGFLPVLCGRFPAHSLVETYQRSPVFLALRDADRLKGKCGRCEYRHICGGSRARAYALTGDILAEEPDCTYVPASRARAANQPNEAQSV